MEICELAVASLVFLAEGARIAKLNVSRKFEPQIPVSMSSGDPSQIPSASFRSANSADEDASVFLRHDRRFEENRFVYPVVSRRSRGLSIGVNLNPDRICNFDCIYCQVDRRSEAETRFVDMDRLLSEMNDVLAQAVSGEIFQSSRLKDTPRPLRRLNDIAFSGDGEPTTFVNFHEIVERVAVLRRAIAPPDCRIVLITNASMFHRHHVQRGLGLLDENNGQIWAKLDAGTERYFQKIERTKVSFQRILDNITMAAQQRPLVIQSLFMNVADESPERNEIDAFCERLNEVIVAGGKIEHVQIYTVARPPAESYVSPLSTEQLNWIAARVKSLCGLEAVAYASRHPAP